MNDQDIPKVFDYDGEPIGVNFDEEFQRLVLETREEIELEDGSVYQGQWIFGKNVR